MQSGDSDEAWREEHPGRVREPFQFFLLLLCFFLSGLAALIYQTAWTQQFAFVFGTSELAVATVLAAYMAGLALGAEVAARFALGIRRPVLVYAVLELAIGLSALAVPWAIRAATGLYVMLFGGLSSPSEAHSAPFTLFFLACSFLILVVPTALMGATLPLLIRHAVRRPEEIGRRVGVLYAANTLGAVAGTLTAGFWLLVHFGLSWTIWTGVAVNGLVFLAAVALARRDPTPHLHGEAASEAREPLAPIGRRAWIAPAMLASGACSFAYEVLWTRLLGHVLGGSIYAFATMLATFLTGIALGALVASRFATSPRRAASAFGWTQIGIATCSLLAYFALAWLPEVVRALEAGLGASVTADAAVSALVLLPSTLFIGATFPLAVRVLAQTAAHASPASARIYAWNTVGAIVGALGAGFFLLPVLGYAGTLIAAVAINVVLAAGSGFLVPGLSRRILVPVGLLAAFLLLARVQPPWSILTSSLGGAQRAQGEVTFYEVGRSATVLMLEHAMGWQLRTNGLIEAEIQRRGERPALDLGSKWLGRLPVLARPDTESMFMVGLGGGVALEDLPAPVRHIDVLELERRVVDANRSLSGRRRSDPLSDPRIHVGIDDARSALLLTDRRYDAIVSQPSHPWTGGAAHLYTRDFFELARRHLTPDGVLVQWMGVQFVDVELLRSLVATLHSVFPHVRVYSPLPDWVVLFVASAEPLDLEESAGRALAAAPEAFRPLGLRSELDIRAALLLDEKDARRFADGAEIITDDHNLLKVRSPKLLLETSRIQQEWRRVLVDHDSLAASADESEMAYLVRRLAREQKRDRARQLASTAPDAATRSRLLLIARGAVGDVRERDLERALAAAPGDPELRALALRMRGPDGAPRVAVAGELRPVERLLVEAWRRSEAQDDGALRALDAELAAVVPTDPLFEDAWRLRVAWRARSGDPERVREGRALLETELAVWPITADLLQRAELATLDGDEDAVSSSLRELLTRPDATAAEIRRAAELFAALEPSGEDEIRRATIAALLAQRGVAQKHEAPGGR